MVISCNLPTVRYKYMVTSCNLPTVQYKYMYISVHRSGFLETEYTHAFYILYLRFARAYINSMIFIAEKKCSCHRYNLNLLNTCILN